MLGLPKLLAGLAIPEYHGLVNNSTTVLIQVARRLGLKLRLNLGTRP